MHSFDLPHHLMVACALGASESGLRAAFERAIPGAASQALLDAAARNQLRPQLAPYAGVLRGPHAAQVAAQLETCAAACRGLGLFAAAELKRVLQALHEGGIDAVTFKGPAFATFFGTGPALREMTDLDVLVDERNLRDATDVLRGLGYRPLLSDGALASASLVRIANEVPLRHDSGTLLELHWRFAPPWCPASIAARDVLARVHPRDFHGVHMLWPGVEELLLVHVSDAMKSGGCGIRWVGDVAAILRSATLDWERVRAIARRNEGLNSVRIALAIVEDLCDGASGALGLPLDAGLDGAAKSLAAEARRVPRLARALDAAKRRLGDDAHITRPAESLAWAVRIADRRARVVAEIVRHLAGPSVTDLEQLPPNVSAMSLRAHALRRRFATYLGAQ
jgi:hypothetical protein